MGLSVDLISQFAKITNDKTQINKETTVYGTAVKYGGETYVQFDGSDIITPVNSTVDVKEVEEKPNGVITDGERVTVTIKNHVATATGNLESPAARIDTVNEILGVVDIQDSSIKIYNASFSINNDVVTGIKGVDDVDWINTEYIEANNANIEELKSKYSEIESLKTEYADIEKLVASKANVTDLDAINADIESLQSNKANVTDLTAINANIGNLQSTKADIADLNAINAEINNLQADVGDIDTLIFGSATGTTIQTSFSNSVIAQLGDAQIKSAMVESITANKITSGDVITNNVRVRSEDGSLVISDETMQISDGTRVRVQIGKDASDDYSINIWDADGNLMFSKGGITDKAIKEAIIRNDMVSDTANIAAHKLDIDSLFEEINGSKNTIKSTRIYLDDEGQTLDVAFESMSTDIDELQNGVSSQGTQLSAVQGQITSKVWQQDIDAIAIGGRNLLLDTDFGDEPIRNERPEGDSKTEFGVHFYPTVDIEIGSEYTVSARIRGNANVVFYEITDNINKSHFWIHRDALDETEFRHFSFTFTADQNYGRLIDAYICTQRGESNTLVGDWFEVESRSVKLEKGNKATDWTPAPEDTETTLSSLSNQYSTIEQNLSSISATVAQHTTDIASKANDTKVTEVSNKVGNLELSLEQFQTSVSETYATKTELNSVGSDVDAVESKVSSAETKINQNANSIASLATRTETIENDYSTKTEMNSAIEQRANGIMTSVSQTYATNTALNATNNTANAAKSSIDNLAVGGRNLLLDTKFDGEAKRYERLEGYGSEGGFHFYPTEQIESGVEYVLSLSIRGNANIVFYEINSSGGNFDHAWVRRAQLSEEDFRDFYLTFSVDKSRVFEHVYICAQYGEDATFVGDWFEIKSCSVKLERGNRKTDWTPAPEDMATTDDVSAVQVSVNSAEERITTTESLIQQLSDSIVTLVTDGDGQSLMTQTDTGWTFSTGELQDIVNSTSENLDSLINDVGDIDSAVGILQQAVDDIGVLNDYIKITTYESEPCIELGETDSDFKLMITNTRIMFMEGTDIPAYISNQSLHIKKAVIEEELQQGEFLWKARSNGNLGLIWKGATD